MKLLTEFCKSSEELSPNFNLHMNDDEFESYCEKLDIAFTG